MRERAKPREPPRGHPQAAASTVSQHRCLRLRCTSPRCLLAGPGVDKLKANRCEGDGYACLPTPGFHTDHLSLAVEAHLRSGVRVVQAQHHTDGRPAGERLVRLEEDPGGAQVASCPCAFGQFHGDSHPEPLCLPPLRCTAPHAIQYRLDDRRGNIPKVSFFYTLRYRWRLLRQASILGAEGEFEAGSHVKFLVDIMQVNLDGSLADEQRRADLLVL